MTANLFLRVVEDREPSDAVIHMEPKPGLLLIEGNEPGESLACGNCKQVLVKNMSTRSFRQKYATRSRLLIKCPCGALNLTPAEAVGDDQADEIEGKSKK